MYKKIVADLENIGVRAGKTFVQAFIASLAVTGFQLTKAALVAAASAGVSAVWNAVLASQK